MAEATTDLAPKALAHITVVHTSDVHIGGHRRGHAPLAMLHAVLATAAAARADALILAGDTFDSHRVPDDLLGDAGFAIAAAAFPVVLLPGNHDPATADAVYHRAGFAGTANLHIIGVHTPHSVLFDRLSLEISGEPHLEYADMSPVDVARRRSLRWHVVAAHAHYVRGPDDHHRGWLIRDEQIDALDADYLALGHWDLAQPVGSGRVPAYYSGSPDLARSVNVVRLATAGVEVTRAPLHLED